LIFAFEATPESGALKQMPFLAGGSAWPSALSRARCWRLSERSGDPWQEKRAVQAQSFSRKGD